MKDESKNKTKMILNYMENNSDGITSLDAFYKFGATRLSAIIFNLKKAGHAISSTTEITTDRYGNIVRFSRYKLLASK